MDKEILKRSIRLSARTAMLSVGLSLALVLSACGASSPVVDEGVDDADTEIVEDAETEEEGIIEEEAEDVEAEVDVETDTAEETEVMTDTEVIVDTDVITETELVTETIVTEVMTDTDTTTETGVVVEESDVVTEEMEVTPTPVAEDEDVEATPVPEEEEATQTDTTDMAAAVGVMDAPDEYVRASTLTDYTFENLEGDNIGDIEDMLIDLNDGSVLFLSVEYGGFLDLGDRDIYLPLSAFTIGSEGGLVLNMAEEELDAYPEVEADTWPNFDNADWGAEINDYWTGVGVEVPSLEGRDGTNTAWATNLIGFPLGGWGEVQSSVSDLLINLQSGQAQYALVADDAVGEVGPYIVPIQALNYDRAGEQLTFEGEVNDEVITNAPRLDPAAYPADGTISGDFDEDEGIENTWQDMGFDWWGE